MTELSLASIYISDDLKHYWSPFLFPEFKSFFEFCFLCSICSKNTRNENNHTTVNILIKEKSITLSWEQFSQRCKHLSSKKLKSVNFWIIVKWNLSFRWDDCFCEFLLLHCILDIPKKSKLINNFLQLLSWAFKLAKYEQNRIFGHGHIFKIFFDFYWQSLLKFLVISSFSQTMFFFSRTGVRSKRK